ncbi:MAG: 2-C-methyl-D-erythritol 2,4-cyclodiphosphate synthase, partial [Candidatus Omnitrophica bacterium]|nr:2-C-methyl-D-erythritol 2,4-cyclodiphosphate synthase [Candidatus Omnitrophota bacterium]
DLALAEAMINAPSPLSSPPRRGRGQGEGEVRVGIGFDTHRLVKGRKLWLGGVNIPSPKGALGHSDGDALLHVVSDAILGAIGGGDIGEWFSDKDKRWKNMKSSIILTTVLAEAKRRGWIPYHVDSNIILESPKLGTHKQKIRKNVAKLLGISAQDVSIKARTREGLGPEGEGLAVTCEGVVSMRKMTS